MLARQLTFIYFIEEWKDPMLPMLLLPTMRTPPSVHLLWVPTSLPYEPPQLHRPQSPLVFLLPCPQPLIDIVLLRPNGAACWTPKAKFPTISIA
jgi:hypothetical protein